MHAAPNPADARSTTRLRVRFVDTDLMGITHHGAYFTYLEAARVDWLRRRGATYADWANQGLHLAVIEVHAAYNHPARFDELLDIETTLTELRSASLRFDYRILRAGKVIHVAWVKLACIDDEGRVRRMSDAVRAVMLAKEHVQPSEPI
jgi:acyl-CoA thioester hydrolase